MLKRRGKARRESRDVARNQHYVPQCLLRGFTQGQSEQVWTLDKADGRIFQTSARNVASERDFYNFTADDGSVDSLEPELAKLEDTVAPLLGRIRAERSLRMLSADDRAFLAVFALIQQLRTVHYRENLAHMQRQISQWAMSFAESRGLGAGKLEPPEIARELTEEEVREMSLLSIAKVGDKLPYLLDKTFLLAVAPSGCDFYIGDNPVALFNAVDHGPYGNLGLAVRGIEIYLPISSRLVLMWVCPSYEDDMREAKSRAQKLVARQPEMREWAEPRVREMDQYLESAEHGTAMQFQPGHVERVNWLQVRYAERRIFSQRNDFSFAQRILAERPHLRVGPRGAVEGVGSSATKTRDGTGTV